MSHKHKVKRTRITIFEVSDISLRGLSKNNSQGRKLEYDFEFCTECIGARILDGQPILKGSSEYLDEIANLGDNCPDKVSEYMQHSDFEVTKKEIEQAIELSKKYS
jgi:hypothetical protein